MCRRVRRKRSCCCTAWCVKFFPPSLFTTIHQQTCSSPQVCVCDACHAVWCCTYMLMLCCGRVMWWCGVCVGLPVTLDVFVPALKLALEYQGEHHYRETGTPHHTITPLHTTHHHPLGLTKATTAQQIVDKQKRSVLESHGTSHCTFDTDTKYVLCCVVWQVCVWLKLASSGTTNCPLSSRCCVTLRSNCSHHYTTGYPPPSTHPSEQKQHQLFCVVVVTRGATTHAVPLTPASPYQSMYC